MTAENNAFWGNMIGLPVQIRNFDREAKVESDAISKLRGMALVTKGRTDKKKVRGNKVCMLRGV